MKLSHNTQANLNYANKEEIHVLHKPKLSRTGCSSLKNTARTQGISPDPDLKLLGRKRLCAKENDFIMATEKLKRSKNDE